MTNAELLDDLNDRIVRGLRQIDDLVLRANNMADIAREAEDEERQLYWVSEMHRLSGKAEGMKVVRDWLRAYDPPPRPTKGEPVMRERIESAFGPALKLTYADGSTEKVFDPS